MARISRIPDTLVVGAGPAGIGTALALAAVDDLSFGVVERGSIGQTFQDWPAEQRFLTPSFTSNGFGATDLNAIHPNTSPAFSLGIDYPDGPGYAAYLRSLVRHYELPVLEQARVTSVEALADGTFRLTIHQDGGAEQVRCRSLVWAGGEFCDPAVPSIPGGEMLDHAGADPAWTPRHGRLVVIGGYESGMDLACHHVLDGHPDVEVTVVDSAAPWGERPGSDPSYSLAPRTQIQLRDALDTGRLHLITSDAVQIGPDSSETGHRYVVELADGNRLVSDSRPIAAVGYGPGLGPIAHLFETREDGWPLLDEDDQSTVTPGLFIAGPAVRHDALRFCFVYKFRQRFAHVARVIGSRLDKDVDGLDYWRTAGMLIDDLSCCGTECAC